VATRPDHNGAARAPRARDRTAFIELFAPPEVGTYLGGPLIAGRVGAQGTPRTGRRPDSFAVKRDGAMIGMITIDRRDAERRATSTAASRSTTCAACSRASEGNQRAQRRARLADPTAEEDARGVRTVSVVRSQ
jgi:hypothetical protein